MYPNHPFSHYFSQRNHVGPHPKNFAHLLGHNFENPHHPIANGSNGLQNGISYQPTQGFLNHVAIPKLATGFKVANSHAVQGVGKFQPALTQITQFSDRKNGEQTGKALIGTDKPSGLEEVKILQPHSKKISKKSHEEEFLSSRTRRTWKQWEDNQIMELIQKHGKNWTLISRLVGGTRTGKQIRDRYLNKLNPSITKTEWTKEEDLRLLELFKVHGRKWTQIAKYLPGRTESNVKNRFLSKFGEMLHSQPPMLPQHDAIMNNLEIMKSYSLMSSYTLSRYSSNRRDDSYPQLSFDDSETSLPRSSMDKLEEIPLPILGIGKCISNGDLIKTEMEEESAKTKLEESISNSIQMKPEPETNCKTESEPEESKVLHFSDLLSELKDKVKVLEDTIQSKCKASSWIQAIEEVACRAPENAETSKMTKEINSGISEFKASFRSATQDINKLLSMLPDY